MKRRENLSSNYNHNRKEHFATIQMIPLLSYNPVKITARIFLCPLFFFTFACCLLPQDTIKAAEATPGSPEFPLTYEGPKPSGSNSVDGHLLFSPDVQNMEIYRSSRKPSAFFGGPGYTYAHHIDLACWKGQLYAAWGATLKDEDVLPGREVYATSEDGFHWSEPKNLFPPGQGWNMRFYFYHATNDTMLAFASGLTAPDEKRLNEDHKTTIYVRQIYANHELGPVWTLLQPRSWDPAPYTQSKDAAFVTACVEAINNRPLLEQQDYGQLLGDRKMSWHDPKNWPNGKIGGRSKYWTFGKAMDFFHRQDGTLVGLSKLGFVTQSSDGGNTWSMPVVPKGIVTGSGKIWGQRTGDDRYALIYNPWTGPRFPLVIDTSDDGITFHDMRVVHGEVPPTRYRGKAKGPGPQYIRGVAEWAGDAETIKKFEQSAIWIIYSMNKEDIWISRIALPVKANSMEPVDDTFDDVPAGQRVPNWHTYAPAWTQVDIAKDPQSKNQFLELIDGDPVDYARAIRTFPANNAATVSFRLQAEQADHGRMEIDLLGKGNARAIQLILNGQGKLQALDGTTVKDLGMYQSGSWMNFTIQYKDGTFSLQQDSNMLLENAQFTEATSNIYAISFRTGEYRGTAIDERPIADMTGAENPITPAAYRIDDVKVSQ